MSGRGAACTPSVSQVNSGGLQREEKASPPTPNTYAAAVKKILDALAETPAAKELKAKAAEMGKDFLSSVEGKVIAGSALGGALAAIIATNSELPMQIPELPLDFIAPALKAKLTWEGPVQKPTSVGLTLTSAKRVSVSGSYSSTPASPGKPAEQKGGLTLTIPLGGPASKKPPGPTESEKFRAESARLAAEQARIRESQKTPADRAEDKAFWDSYWRSKIKDPLKPVTLPGPIVPEHKKEEEPLMRKEAQSGRAPEVIPLSVNQALRSPGQPLDSATLSFMDSRFGHDFSEVRVHSGGAAEQSAKEFNANAYTVGHDIVFGAGRFAPGTPDGRRLLAHELTHVVQQKHASPGTVQCKDETATPLTVGANEILPYPVGARVQVTSLIQAGVLDLAAKFTDEYKDAIAALKDEDVVKSIVAVVIESSAEKVLASIDIPRCRLRPAALRFRRFTWMWKLSGRATVRLIVKFFGAVSGTGGK